MTDASVRNAGDLLQDLNAVVWELDAATGQFTFVSQAAERILGYPVRSWLEEPGFWQNRIVHQDDRDRAMDFSAKAKREGGAHELEYRAVTADGRTVWLESRVQAVVDADDEPRLIRGLIVEITEQRRAAGALGEAEERFRQLAENIDAVFWLYDIAEGRTIYASPAYDRVWGRSREELTTDRRAWARAIHPADRERVLAAMGPTPAMEYEIQYRIVRPDGEVRWILDRGFPVRDGSREVYRTAGVAQDITEQHRAAEALRESDQKFRQIAENVGEIFWIFNPDFTETVYVSPAYEQIWGRELAGIYQDASALVEAVHPEDLESLTTAMRNIKSGPVEGVEFRIVHPDGMIRWVLARGYPVFDEDGDVYRVVGTTEDITTQKEAEARLTAAEAHYRRLVENAPYAIYALDADGRFIELNPAGERLVDRSAEDVLGEPFSVVIAPADLDIATSAFQRVIAREADHLEFEVRVRRPSGEVRLIRATESAIRENGVIVGTHGVARDITDEVARERQLRQAERLASIGTLIGGVAHELNNPLHAITNFTTLLLDECRSEEQRGDLETIQREALRAARIVSDLRLLARGTQDEPGERVPVDMNEVVRHVLKTRRYTMETGNINVLEELAAELPPVLADRAQMEQVVLNIVVNAEHAMAHSEERRLVVRTRASARGLALHIEDSGLGIAPEHLQRVFDPFFTTKNPGDGTGLGLSVVHGIVNEHGGAVHAESKPGHGTAFRLELPRAPEVGSSRKPSAAIPDPRRPLRILIVDDEEAIRRALGRYLTRRRGHQVDEAADGREALAIVRRAAADYDVIVSDLRMPGLGGDQFLAHLIAADEGLHRRVIFLTGDAASGHAASLLEAAKAPVIYKPVDLAELARRIEQHAEDHGTANVPNVL